MSYGIDKARAIIFELSKAAGSAGQEKEALAVAREMLSQYGEVSDVGMGNIVCRSGAVGSDYKILLDAHIDEIGLIVTGLDDGFVKVSQLGGADRRTLLSQEVVIWGKQPVNGVFCTMPPHLTSQEDMNKYPDIPDMSIDTGLGKKASDIISIGDRVTLKVTPKKLAGSRITGKSLDNRAGVASLILALEILKGCPDIECEVLALISSQEEVGERGAITAAFDLDFDEAVVVDVSFSDAPSVPEYKCGKMGAGAMIGISPFVDRRIFEKLVETAKNEDIIYQFEVMGGGTGTNMDSISISKSGAPSGLISIPVRNMHTGVETVDIVDVISAASLTAAYIRAGGIKDV